MTHEITDEAKRMCHNTYVLVFHGFSAMDRAPCSSHLGIILYSRNYTSNLRSITFGVLYTNTIHVSRWRTTGRPRYYIHTYTQYISYYTAAIYINLVISRRKTLCFICTGAEGPPRFVLLPRNNNIFNCTRTCYIRINRRRTN